MKNVLGILVVLAVVALSTRVSEAKFSVTEAPDSCANAHAVLVASKSGKHDYIWREIGRVVKTRPYTWRVVPEHEPGVAQKVSFRQWDTRYVEGGTAYIAHCGHGGTCNSLAHAFFEKHSDWGSPVVFCGPVPELFENPQRVDL